MSCDFNASDREDVREFVACIFENWFGLQMAISHGMGGSPRETMAKLSQMIDAISDMYCSSSVSEEDLSDSLEDMTDEFFNTEFEDGSIDEIASLLWTHKQEWLVGNKDGIKSYITAMKSSSKTVLQRLDGYNEKMDTNEQTDTNSFTQTSSSSSPQLVEDSDGWTTQRHYRRRNC